VLPFKFVMRLTVNSTVNKRELTQATRVTVPLPNLAPERYYARCWPLLRTQIPKRILAPGRIVTESVRVILTVDPSDHNGFGKFDDSISL